MADRAAGGPVRHAERCRTLEEAGIEAWTVIARIVNIRARKLIPHLPMNREDVLKVRLPLSSPEFVIYPCGMRARAQLTRNLLSCTAARWWRGPIPIPAN